MAGTRRLTVVTAFTVTGLLFSGGALKAFADAHTRERSVATFS